VFFSYLPLLFENEKSKKEPGYCPPTYYGILKLLKRCIQLLNVLFGTRCAHLVEVQGVYQAAVYETMSSRDHLEGLFRRQIIAECLSHLGPTLPESALYTLRHYIRRCSLKVTITCPVARGATT
jgi:hypothetical protein